MQHGKPVHHRDQLLLESCIEPAPISPRGATAGRSGRSAFLITLGFVPPPAFCHDKRGLVNERGQRRRWWVLVSTDIGGEINQWTSGSGRFFLLTSPNRSSALAKAHCPSLAMMGLKSRKRRGRPLPSKVRKESTSPCVAAVWSMREDGNAQDNGKSKRRVSMMFHLRFSLVRRKSMLANS